MAPPAAPDPSSPTVHRSDPMSDGNLPFGPLCYRIDRKEIVYISDLLESYEDLGVVRTLDSVAAIIEILYAPDLYDTLIALMDELAADDIPSLERCDPPQTITP